jgi:hypothetical protein
MSSDLQCLLNLDTSLNPQVPIVPHKTAALKSTTTRWLSKFACCSMALVSQLSFGPLYCYMPSIYITGLSTWRLELRHSKVGTPGNRMLLISKLLGPGSASSVWGCDVASSIDTTLPEFSLGYTAANHNIVYLNTTSNIVKSCHHAIFNKTWYLQPTRPPAAQLLYNLGLKAESDFVSLEDPVILITYGNMMPSKIPWPLLAGVVPKTAWTPPQQCLFVPLPLHVTETPLPLVAQAAQTTAAPTQLSPRVITSQTVTDYLIGPNDLVHIYLSPDPFGCVFDETLDLRK